MTLSSSHVVDDLDDEDCVFQPGAATLLGAILTAFPMIMESVGYILAHQCGIDSSCATPVQCVCDMVTLNNGCAIGTYIHLTCVRDLSRVAYLVFMPCLMLIDIMMHRKYWTQEVIVSSYATS